MPFKNPLLSFKMQFGDAAEMSNHLESPGIVYLKIFDEETETY